MKELSVKEELISGNLKDGSVKVLLSLNDNLKIESVLMVYNRFAKTPHFSAGDEGKAVESLPEKTLGFQPREAYRDWITACVSVMVGCPLGCKFCATGKMGFQRNLTSREIVDQVAFWNNYLSPMKKRVSRLVFMGMGEPFLNWDETQKAIAEISIPGRFNIGYQQMTISTVGIIPEMYKFADLKSKINLAISLHSPFQEKREQIIPIAKKYPITELMRFCGHYVKLNNRKIFFEYALIDKFNDTFEDIFALKKLFGSSLFHLNVIVLNPTGGKYKGSGMGRRETFVRALEKYKIPFTIRRSLGKEINAACGQLATQTALSSRPEE